jgi:hypothetical protein
MSAPEEQNLIRFARLLAAHFDANGENANLVAGGSSNFKRCFSLCHAPCGQGQQVVFSSLSLNYNWHRDITQSPTSLEHTEYIKLLSREISFGKQNVSFAPTTLLRNVVLSFGKLLEFQLQRTIFLVMEAYKSKSIERKIKEEDRDRIFQAFKQLSSPHISVAKPLAASISFSSMVPDNDLRQKEYGEQEFSTCFLFEVDMIVLLPKNLTLPISLKAPSRFLAKFSNESLPDSIDVTIDTKQLYENMRRQCKIISKKVIIDAVGFDIFAKSKRAVIPSQGNGMTNGSSISPSTDASTVFTCETISFSNPSTVKSSEGLRHDQRQDPDNCEIERREPESQNIINDDDKFKRDTSVIKKKHGLRHFFSKKTSSSESF